MTAPAIDWKRLVQVRERHKAVAQEQVGRERQVAAERDAAMRQAQAELQQQVDAKAHLWAQTAQPAGGAMSVGSLCQASAWSHALDGQIAQAAQGVRQAQAEVVRQQAVLNESRKALRTAAGHLEKAEQMGRREHVAQERLRDGRLETTAEDHAAQVWSLQHRPA